MLIEGIDLAAVALRALSFVLMLQAAGLALFMTLFAAELNNAMLLLKLRAWMRRSAVVALLVVLLHQGLQAGRMSGEWQGVLDTDMQHLAWFSDAGVATGLRVLGLMLIAVSVRYAWCGALIVCASFLFMGHTVVHPQRLWLMPLLSLHLVIAATWFGGLLPLHLASRHEAASAVSQLTLRFSQRAIWSVPLIALAGVAMATLLLPDWQSLLQPYGLLLLAKLAGFIVLMILAALNKWRWGMQLQAGQPGVHQAFRRTLLGEYALIILVLLMTAVMTSFFSPD